MRVVAGEARQVNLSATITASSSQTTLAAVQTTLTPSGGTSYTYAGTLAKPTGSSAALDSATTANPSFTPDVVGVYVVTLTATDTASGATVTKVRTQEVGTSVLSVSIAEVADQAGLTGVITLNATVSNAIGGLAYSWAGEDPTGAAIIFADAAAVDTTVTMSDTAYPGTWSATLTVTDSARDQTASATVRWTTGGLPTATTPRAIYIAVVASVLSWKEQALIGSHWVDISAYAALTVEIDGGVTFSGTTMTLPSGLAATTTPHASGDERYVAFTSCTAALQALVAAGGRWQLDVNADTVENVDYGRIGWSVSSAAGSFDAAGENLLHARLGWDVTAGAYRLQIAASSGSFNNADTSASLGVLRFGAQIATANTGGVYAPAWSYNSSFSPGTDVPTRLYVTGSAQTSATAATIAVGNPTARLAFFPVVA